MIRQRADIQLLAGVAALVIGLGRSGRACLDVLLERGLRVAAIDDSPAALSALRDDPRYAGVEILGPEIFAEYIVRCDVAILSPGIPPAHCLVQQAIAAGVPVIGEIEAAFILSKAPIIAITGTKGKSTTTALTGALLRTAGFSTFVGGNIGNALIAETAVAGADAWVVAEISSFQLETIVHFQPRIAALLNISADHLDRYGSMDEYIAAKERIFMNQGPDDALVLNLDDAVVAAMVDTSAIVGQKLCYTLRPHPAARLYVDHAIIYWRPTMNATPIEIMPTSEVTLLGEHNLSNLLAAVLLALTAGVTPTQVRQGVQAFRPLPHRLQTVAEVDGVRYIDDSKATNPGAVAAALETFSEPIVLIAGGKAKGTDFAELGEVINAHAQRVILIGEAAAEIGRTVQRVPTHYAASMQEAVMLAHNHTQPGAVVLLSPGCASFDMFTSAEARGDAFTQAAQHLSQR